MARGELDALCALGVINEGVDVPAIDRVTMLGSTASGLFGIGSGTTASTTPTSKTPKVMAFFVWDGI